jgi:L-ascorbate metabolism protein UlaG (beta-lactamase superfamily)
MRLTKFGHACIRVEGPGGTLVIDPGGLSEDAAIEGADAVLITHEHYDHFVEGRLRAAAALNPALEIWTVAAVADLLSGLGPQVRVVGDGDRFTTAGFAVEAHGSRHAQLHPDIPVVANTGFLVEESLFHPGDALTVPDRPVKTLMVPVHAPWSCIGDLIDWVREISPERAFAVHDGALNAFGIAVVDGLLGEYGPGMGATYRRLEPLERTERL